MAKTQENVEGYYSLHITSKSDKSKSITIPQWKQGDLGLNLTGLGEKEEQPSSGGFTYGNSLHNIIYNQQYVASFEGDDLIQSTLDDDVIVAGAGDDAISTGYGNDKIYAGEGHDVIYGGEGEDIIYGEAADDAIFSSKYIFYDVISKFNLGKTHFSQVYIYDIETKEQLSDIPYYFMNIAEKFEFLDVENSQGIKANFYQPNHPVRSIRAPKDDDIKLLIDGDDFLVDLWHDPKLRDSLFFSDELVQSLFQAGFNQKELGLIRCAIN